MNKRILFLITVFSLSTYCGAQTDTLFNQVDARGLRQGYWKITMVDSNTSYLYAIESYKNDKRNGLCTYFFSNGRKSNESYYRNDTLDGLAKVYRDYGGLRYEENFKDGRTDGFKRYYSIDGSLAEEQEYTGGIETGIYRQYSKSGRIVIESFTVNGIENGTRKVYGDNDGHQVIREFDFRNGIKIAARYYKNGKLVKQQQFDYEKGLKEDEELRQKNKYDG